MSIFDALKLSADLYKESGKIEQYKQILDAQAQLLEMQKRIADLENENKDLKEKLRIKEDLIYENNSYWINKEGKKDGPFCSRCWDKNKDLIRIHRIVGNDRKCPECKNHFKVV
jgi:predicted nuclease with TOPRIM domain